MPCTFSRATQTLLKSCCNCVYCKSSVGTFFNQHYSHPTEPNCINLIRNGDFETGQLGPWRINGDMTPIMGTCPQANRNWHIANSTEYNPTGCLNVGPPLYGNYAMYNMLDGTENTFYILEQDIGIPLVFNNIILSWYDKYITSMHGAARTLTIEFVEIGQVYTYSFPLHNESEWLYHEIDVTDLLRNHTTATIRFTMYIPETWTGPGGYIIDNIALMTT